MSHLVETMAYANAVPWHGLGNNVDADSTIEEWQNQAGLNWSVSKRPVHFAGECVPGANNGIHTFKDKFVLVRDTDSRPFSVVSGRYNPVQPKEILEFFRDLIATHGMTIETAGSLKDGKRIWALAKTGDAHKVLGSDLVNSYLLIATSYDLTFSTLAQFTSVRVVCNNTLQQSLNDYISRVSIPHFKDFNADQVHESLGLGRVQWGAFSQALDAIAKIKISVGDAGLIIANALKIPQDIEAPSPNRQHVMPIMRLFNGDAIGSDVVGQTGWGLVNAVTEYVDHRKRARNQGNRLDNAWFGEAANLKDTVFKSVLEMAG
jgi:phage/plasmid-like protein (TIGR03299 family)